MEEQSRFRLGLFPTPRAPHLKAALVKVLDQLSDQHSTTSRRFSVRALFRTELDEIYGATLHNFCFSGWSSQTPLQGFLPSEIWSRAPKSSGAKGRARIQGDTVAARARSCAEAWGYHLLKVKKEVRTLHKACGMLRSEEEEYCGDFYDAIDLMIAFAFSRSLDPHRSESRKTGRCEARQPTSLFERTRKSDNFCELCWRLNEQSEFTASDLEQHDAALDDILADLGWCTEEAPREIQHYWDQRASSCLPASARFCRVHNPRSNGSLIPMPGTAVGSAYRNDLRKKFNFIGELKKLRGLHLKADRRIARNRFGIRDDDSTRTGQQLFVMPASGWEADMRRAAYASVTSRIQGSLQGNVYILDHQRMRDADISSQLDVSVQEVRRARRNLEAKFKAIDNIRLGRGSFPLWE